MVLLSSATMPAERVRSGQSATPAEPPLLRVHLALLAVQLAFAGFAVVAKLVFRELDPLALTAVRVLVATPLLLAFAWHHDRIVPSRRDLPMLALLGMLGVCLNQVLFVLGLERTLATNAAILMPSIPVFAVAVAALTGVERIGRRRLLGIGLAVAGALVVLDPASFRLAPDQSVGTLLILLNCLFYALFLTLQRPILLRLPWRTVIAWAFLFGAVGVGVIGAPSLSATDFARLSPLSLWGIVYVILAPTVFAYAANTWAVRRSTPSLAAAYVTLQPIATAALARVVLDEPLGLRQLGGFFLIAAGLWRVSTAVAQPPTTA